MKLYRSQLWAMNKKAIILQLRYYKTTISYLIIGPILFLLILYVLQQGYHSQQLLSNAHPVSYNAPSFPLCTGSSSTAPCITIMYSPDSPFTQNVMSILAANYLLKTGIALSLESTKLASNIYIYIYILCLMYIGPTQQINSKMGAVAVSGPEFIYRKYLLFTIY